MGLVLAVYTLRAHAQQDTSVSTGLVPYQAYHDGDIDSVNLSNGNLSLHIPFVAYQQRGEVLRLSFVLSYNAKQLQAQKFCVPPPAKGCWWQWLHSTSYDAIEPMSVRPLDDQRATVIVKTVPAFVPPLNYYYYYVNTPDGASHPLGNTNWGTESVDATGFRGDATGTYVIDRTGIRHTRYNIYQDASREDPNGNAITFNGATFTDTLGRLIPTPPPASSGGDVTGCTGPLPIRPRLFGHFRGTL